MLNRSFLKYLILQNKKIHLLLIVLSITVISVLEVLGIGAIPAYLYHIINPEIISEKFPSLFNFLLNFTSKENLSVFILILLVVLFLIKNLIIFFIQIFQINFWMKLRINLSTNIFLYYLSLPLVKFSKINPSIMINNILTESANSSAFIRDFIILVNEILFLLILTSLIIITQPPAIITAIAILFFTSYVFYYSVKSKVKIKGDEGLSFREKYIKFLNQGFGLFRETLVYGKKDYVLSNFEKNIELELKTSAYSKIIGEVPRLLIEVISVTIIFCLTYFYFKNDSVNIKELIPTITLFVIAFIRLIPSVNKIVVQLNRLKFFSTSTYNLSKILFSDELISSKKKSIFSKENIERKFENLILKDVSFNYKDRSDKIKTLEDISFEIKKGEKVAIIGETGAGKSTLLNLIMGIIKYHSGQIFINKDKELKENKNFWFSKLSFVPQDVYLFDGHISQNIILNQNENNDQFYQRLEDVCKKAEIYDFVKSLKSQFKTVVGDRGVEISGGQKQRIGIARALFHTSEILFFDESTSSLDSDTEEKIIKNITSEKNLTFVAATHKISLLKYFDKVIEINNGKVKNIKIN